jgi:ubiquinone/menaquinone biosynthesis C-methylase UbiE
VVMKAVRQGDRVLDAGTGTGSTALLAAQTVGPQGKVTLFDMSEGMLAVARKKAAARGLQDRIEVYTGDMIHLSQSSPAISLEIWGNSLVGLDFPILMK